MFLNFVYSVVVILLLPLLLIYIVASFFCFCIDISVDWFCGLNRMNRFCYIGFFIFLIVLGTCVWIFLNWLNSPETDARVKNYAKNYRLNGETK